MKIVREEPINNGSTSSIFGLHATRQELSNIVFACLTLLDNRSVTAQLVGSAHDDLRIVQTDGQTSDMSNDPAKFECREFLNWMHKLECREIFNRVRERR